MPPTCRVSQRQVLVGALEAALEFDQAAVWVGTRDVLEQGGMVVGTAVAQLIGGKGIAPKPKGASGAHAGSSRRDAVARAAPHCNPSMPRRPDSSAKAASISSASPSDSIDSTRFACASTQSPALTSGRASVLCQRVTPLD